MQRGGRALVERCGWGGLIQLLGVDVDKFELSQEYDGCGPNAMRIRVGGSKVINGPMPAQVRKELMAAVKSGHLGRLKKDGLKPEIFFHPDHKTHASERQKNEALYSMSCIASVMVSPAQFREGIEAMGGDIEEELIARTTQHPQREKGAPA